MSLGSWLTNAADDIAGVGSDILGSTGQKVGSTVAAPFNKAIHGQQGMDSNNSQGVPGYASTKQLLNNNLSGRSPYASQDWSTLIKQLKAGANGNGANEALAKQQYMQASQDQAANLSGMAHGGSSPAALRQAMIQQGQLGQGMASGEATAQNQARIGDTNALTQAIGSRDQLNQNAYMGNLNAMTGLQLGQGQLQLGYQNSNNQNNQFLTSTVLKMIGGVGSGAGAGAGAVS